MRLFQNATYEFIEKRRKAYVVSAVLIIAGILAMGVNVFNIGNWQNYGVDFTGGALVQVRFEEQTSAADLRAALAEESGVTLTQFGSPNEYVIRGPLVEGIEIEQIVESMTRQLREAPEVAEFEVVRTEMVGAKVGSELQEKAALAILFSFLLTMVYIAIRFEFRFGLAAIIATAHDILLTLGFLALFRVEIALPTVAAILTIVGYSLNDTIVVFDRVRENLNRKGGRREDFVKLVDRSINETLPRTVMTSGTTLAVLTALLLLGGAVIRDFTVVLILGVVIGTYSSIFVASPALLEIQKRWENKAEKEKRKAKAKERSATAAV
jgi:preprotein translocase subunit SecF